MGSKSSNRVILAMLVVAALAVGFWMLLLGPRRQEADHLSAKAGNLQTELTEARGRVAEAQAARRHFSTDYQQLVVLGKAVPASDETSSLLVELSAIAAKSGVRFDSIKMSESGGETATAETATATPEESEPEGSSSEPSNAVPAAASVPPTEAAASLLPIGASIGPAGLDVIRYNVAFNGTFFRVADFIRALDSLVHTDGSKVTVDGRLVTLDGFALVASEEPGFPYLTANFLVTTYITPPSQGLTAGATPTAPAPSTATPASTESAEAGEAPEAEAATVSSPR